jgi:predicted nucleic acid-binding protein
MEMRKVLLDTNIYVTFKRQDPKVVEAFHHLDYIGMDVTVLAELYSGFKSGNKEKHNRVELETFLNNPRVHLLQHDHITAEFFSDTYLNLRKKGTLIPTNDIWVAATAMQNGLAVFSRDQHFIQIAGLVVKKS